MSFAQEMKDFLGAASTTMKTMDDHDYKQALGKYQQALTDKAIAETPDDEDNDLEKQKMRAQIAKIRGGISAGHGMQQLDPAAASIGGPSTLSARVPAIPMDAAPAPAPTGP